MLCTDIGLLHFQAEYSQRSTPPPYFLWSVMEWLLRLLKEKFWLKYAAKVLILRKLSFRIGFKVPLNFKYLPKVDEIVFKYYLQLNSINLPDKEKRTSRVVRNSILT
jgi:hypothetical protein